ncbi:hypothetical protein IG631_19029 [Alternaria alternata]|nr:hypothetical protein IG631_19029 [Alternaria alternata]
MRYAFGIMALRLINIFKIYCSSCLYADGKAGEPRRNWERYDLWKSTSTMTSTHKEANAEKAEKVFETPSKKQRSHALDAVVAS